MVFVVALLGASVASAQTSPVLVGADEGSRMRPIARMVGSRWMATCEVPTPPAVRRGTPQRPAVVASGDTVIDAIRYVPRGGKEWQQIEAAVRTVFLQRETQQNVAPATLGRVAIDVETLSTGGPAGSGSIYYFRASKTVRDSRAENISSEEADVDPPGDLRIEVIGWLRAAADRVTPLGTNATLSWQQVEDRPVSGTRRSVLTPIGILRSPAGTVWVMQDHVGDGTWFALYDVGAGGVRMIMRSDSVEC
jgi:hypothetical protein